MVCGNTRPLTRSQFSLGPIQIHWYALSYLIGISLVWWHLSIKNKANVATTSAGKNSKQKNSETPVWTSERLSDLIFYAVLGVILGGRIGYMLFYGMDQILESPLSVLRVWEGGMSFHGGMIGVFLGMYYFARKTGYTFQITDFIAPSIPIALGCGRIGNFINGELPGRVSDVAWAVVYPGEAVARHPSSLYQTLLKGPVLFLFCGSSAADLNLTMAVSGMFLLGYGGLRASYQNFSVVRTCTWCGRLYC